MREKYYSSWKNKLKKMDYKPDERGIKMARQHILLAEMACRHN
jgi:hypothetical protein